MKLQNIWKEELSKLTTFGFKITILDISTRIMKRKIFYVKKHKAILNYLEKHYLNIIQKYDKMNDFSTKIQQTDPIWVFWYQGFEQAPILVQHCLKSLKQNAGQRPVIELNRENFMDYVTLPQYIMDKFNNGKITIVQFSDILRVSLLEKYGGIWSDATIYYNRWIDENLQELSWFSLKSNPENKDPRYVSNYQWSSFFQVCAKNCIIAKYLKDMLYEYWKEHDLPIDYFLFDNILAVGYHKIDIIRKLIDKTPYSNPNIGWLSKNLNKKYAYDEYNVIRRDTALFKLDWRRTINNESGYNGSTIIFRDKVK